MTVSRLAGIPPTVFAEMTALAVRTGAINLGQGFPDVDGPAPLLERAAAAIAGGRNQYPPGAGVPELRAAIARHQRRHYSLELDPDTEVVVTTGATEAIAGALLGLVEPGEEVVVLAPWFDSYDAVITMAGAVRRAVTLRAPDFRLDADALRAAVGPRTRVLLVNSPHNPTGRVLDADELAAIAAVALEHDLVVVTDEVYEHLTFDGAVHTPLATLPGMRERTLTISSAGKSYSVTGWKVGWATGPAHLVGAVLAVKQWLTYASGAPLQPAVAFALDELPDAPRELARDLQRQRDQLVGGLTALGVPTCTPSGTYFALSDVAPLGWDDGRSFALALPERAGVVVIPTQGFHDGDDGRHLVRWAFCKRPATLASALERLGDARLVP